MGILCDVMTYVFIFLFLGNFSTRKIQPGGTKRERKKRISFLSIGRGGGPAGRGDLGGGHQVTDVFLEEFVVVVEFVVFFLDGFDACEDFEEGGLQGFGVSDCVC